MNLNDIIDDYKGNFLADAISHGSPDKIIAAVKTAIRHPATRDCMADLIGHRVIEDSIAYAEGMDDPTAESESKIRELAEDNIERDRFVSSGGSVL